MRVVETGLAIFVEKNLESVFAFRSCLVMFVVVFVYIQCSLRENLYSENSAIDIVLFVCTVQVCHTA